MDTETRLIASVEQAKELIQKLQTAIREGERGNIGWARITLEQVKHDGPWGLIIGVREPE